MSGFFYSAKWFLVCMYLFIDVFILEGDRVGGEVERVLCRLCTVLAPSQDLEITTTWAETKSPLGQVVAQLTEPTRCLLTKWFLDSAMLHVLVVLFF